MDPVRSSAIPHASVSEMQFLTAERRQQLRFLLAGAWNTVFGYFAFLLAYQLLGGSYASVPALILGYAFALPQSYVVQRFLVFRSRSAWRAQFTRFALANTAIFVANLAMLPMAIKLFDTDPRIAQAVFVVLSTIISYLAHKHFSFRQP